MKGAETSIYLASSPDVAGITGKYFSKCREAPVNKEALDPGICKRLWEKSEELTGLK